MKRTCTNCTHYAVNEDGDHYCRKHREHPMFLNGCDDAWPKDRDPRCDECRFWVEKIAPSSQKAGVEEFDWEAYAKEVEARDSQ